MDESFIPLSFADMLEAQDETVYTPKQIAFLERLTEDTLERFADKPSRLKHTLGVRKTALGLAHIYHADSYTCQVAALLHDWDKYLVGDDLIREAENLKIDMGVDLHLVEPLLHGKITARKVPAIYPEVSASALRAIDAHTTGEMHPTHESAVIYIADLIEPGRPNYDSIQKIRSLVGKVDLKTLYYKAMSSTIQYLEDTDKYVWPGAYEILETIENSLD